MNAPAALDPSLQLCDIYGGCLLLLQAPLDAVWQQLDKLCDRSPLCAPHRLADLRAAYAQQQQTVHDLKQRAKGLESQPADGTGGTKERSKVGAESLET